MTYLVDWEEVAKLPPEEQANIAHLLDQLMAGAENNPMLFFQPHYKQLQFLMSRARWKWFLGGNRSGKTVAAVIDDLIQACDEEAVPSHLRDFKQYTPPFKWRIVAMDFDQIELVVFEELKRWVPPSQLAGGQWKTAYNRERRTLRFQNGSICQFKTYEQPAFNHGGTSMDRIHFDEEPPEDIYRENRARIIDNNGDIIISMTPVHGMSWMYDSFYLPYQKGELKNAFVQLVGMDDNPYLSKEGREAALSEYSAEEREARETGRFVALHGLVYPSFKNEVHILPEPELDDIAGKTVYVGIDPGIRHMAAVVFVYHTLDDNLIQFDEIAAQGKTVAEVSKEIAAKLIHWKIRPSWYVIDPSARNLQHNTGRSLQMEYADYGIHAFPGQNDVRAGINRVSVRLEHRKLFITANCSKTIEEFRKYRWSKPPRASENDPKEAPVKRDDHLLDALRYIVMARPYKPERERTERPVDVQGNDLQGADLAAWKDRRRVPKKEMPNWLR